MSDPSSLKEGTQPLRRGASFAVAGAALLAALVVPSGPPGAGLFLAGIGIAAAVAAGRPRRLDAGSAGFAGAALILVATAGVRDARWLILLDVAAAAGCSALAATGARTWSAVFRAPFRVTAQSARVPVALARSLPHDGAAPAWAGALVRGAGVSAVLLVTFGALFSSADAAFARIAGDVLLPDVRVDLLPARVVVALLVTAGTGGLILAGRSSYAQIPGDVSGGALWSRGLGGREPRKLATVEWALPLALLNALFAAFVIVQLAVLFGGHRHVLSTQGLTYAQYARTGFFQLIAIAALTLGVLALARRLVRDERREKLLKALLGALCLLTLVVLASALRRMNLYEAAYGLTRIRVAVYAVDLWLAGVFALVLVAGLFRRAPWLPRAVLAFSAVALVAFNVANPDAQIARSGVERWRETGQVDSHYLSTLSADAVPALLELPEEERACILAGIAGRLEREPDPWTSFNLARDRARELSTMEETQCSSYP